ncbi:dihydrofolate reductase family protein [Isoptericola sp. 4D.3]|uniref:Dihydrofolate reductase family protein n=1 Tax=Isoptericola peretonis TaxID=2918523 RepID=A0ABT0IYM8_9MICO|nr:dihydrofolate reductase family protein [Isoptericola sp. 4D.3]
MRLSVNIFTSLDGVVQGPGGPDEDTRGGFAQGGWFVPFTTDPMFGEVVDGWFAEVDAFLLGRTTYDIFVASWAQVTDPEDALAARINAGPRYVVSATLSEPEWPGTTVIDPAHLAARVQALKDGPDGELQVHGSARLASTLHDLGLVDVYRVFVAPAVIGSGARLFGDGAAPSGLAVTRSRIGDSGLVYLELEPRPLERGVADVVDGEQSVRPVE